MRKAALLLVCSITVLALTGCETSCSYSTAELSGATMARSIDPDTQAPVETASTFGPETGAIYAVAKISYAPPDTEIRASFHYLENGDQEIASDAITAGGESWVSFALSPPETGWPTGQYEARFHLNGEQVQRVPFNVAPTSARVESSPVSEPRHSTPPPSSNETSRPPEKPVERKVARSDTEGTKLFTDEKFGIALEYPSSWSHRVTPEKDYLIEGPRGTDAFELYVLLQFVSKRANPGSSAVDQAKGILAEVMQIPDAELRTQEMLSVGGQDAPYFVATYTAKNSHQKSTTFGHTQIVLDHGDHYYHVCYFGPAEIYEKYSHVFQHIVDTFAFTD